MSDVCPKLRQDVLTEECEDCAHNRECHATERTTPDHRERRQPKSADVNMDQFGRKLMEGT